MVLFATEDVARSIPLHKPSVRSIKAIASQQRCYPLSLTTSSVPSLCASWWTAVRPSSQFQPPSWGALLWAVRGWGGMSLLCWYWPLVVLHALICSLSLSLSLSVRYIVSAPYIVTVKIKIDLSSSRNIKWTHEVRYTLMYWVLTHTLWSTLSLCLETHVLLHNSNWILQNHVLRESHVCWIRMWTIMVMAHSGST